MVVRSRAYIAADLCGDRPHIAGHRIRVQDIVAWHEHQGMSADEIVTNFPQITLSDVYAALAYYLDHREEVDRQIREDEEFVERAKREYARRHLELPGKDADDDSVSP